MKKKIVLIADDDQALNIQLVRAFTERGYHALGVQTFEEALDALNRLTPDLAVLDLRISRTDSGIDILREIRKRSSECKVVMLTAFGSIPTAVEATRLGIEDFVAKPADVENILFALGELGEKGTKENLEIELPSLRRTEWEHIQRALQLTDGNISRASELLQIPRRSLQRKLQRTPESF